MPNYYHGDGEDDDEEWPTDEIVMKAVHRVIAGDDDLTETEQLMGYAWEKGAQTGREQGLTAGHEQGFTAGHEKGFEAGVELGLAFAQNIWMKRDKPT